MKLKHLSFILLGLISNFAFGQKPLLIEDITPEGSIWPCEDRHEALVEIRCNENFELEFKSNLDDELPITRVMEGTTTIYRIVFITFREGVSYKKRTLSIIAPTYDQLSLSLGDLQEKTKRVYLVSDPNSSLRSVFYISQDQAFTYFTQGEYHQAEGCYYKAKSCAEYAEQPKIVDDGISLCEKMITLTNRADSLEKAANFSELIAVLRQMQTQNPTNEPLKDRLTSAVTKLNARSNSLYGLGKDAYEKGLYEEAKEYFESLLALNVDNEFMVDDAQKALLSIKTILANRYNRVHTFFYQYDKNRPFGFTTASCKPKGTGAYLTVNVNKSAIDLVAQKAPVQSDTLCLDFEAGASIGMTVPLYQFKDKNDKPLFGFWAFGTIFGYNGGGYKDMDGKINWYHSVTPEIGIIARVWRFAINYKYQYRYPILTQDSDIERLMGGSRHSFGIGFTW